MMKNIIAAQKLLAYVMCPAVICGGYARDTYLSKPIRDVDLYVPDEFFWSTAIKLFGPDVRMVLGGVEVDEDSVEYLHQSIKRQFEYDLKSDLDFGLPTRRINLIGLRGEYLTVPDVTYRFNLGICKIGIDNNGMQQTYEFAKDKDDKQITLYRTDWGHEATLKQFIKLQHKYPWPLRINKEDLNAVQCN